MWIVVHYNFNSVSCKFVAPEYLCSYIICCFIDEFATKLQEAFDRTGKTTAIDMEIVSIVIMA